MKELKRKTFHVFSLLYTLGYVFMERSLFLKIMLVLLVLVAVLEFGRLLLPGLNRRLLALFGGIQREHEKYKPSGILWTLAGAFATMLIFPDRSVVLCAMSYLIFGDLAAALAGTKYGRHKILGKSVEGSLAFFGISLAAGLYFFDPLTALLGALFATIVEFLPLPGNDNLWIPLLSAAFLSLLLTV